MLIYLVMIIKLPVWYGTVRFTFGGFSTGYCTWYLILFLVPLLALFHCMVRHGTVHFWGVFHWVLYLVPGTFLVPLWSRFYASRTVTKT